MAFGKSLGGIAGKVVSQAITKSGAATKIANKVDIPGILNKIPGLDNPNIAPIKDDVMKILDSTITKPASEEIIGMQDTITMPEVNTSLLNGIDSKMDAQESKTHSGYGEGNSGKQEKMLEGQTNISTNFDSTISDISQKTNNNIEIPEINFTLGGENQ